MPRNDGTGPLGVGGGNGLNRNSAGVGKGRMGGPLNAGPQGYCLCPNCGNKVVHQRATPCNAIKCPECGATMTRG